MLKAWGFSSTKNKQVVDNHVKGYKVARRDSESRKVAEDGGIEQGGLAKWIVTDASADGLEGLNK